MHALSTFFDAGELICLATSELPKTADFVTASLLFYDSNNTFLRMDKNGYNYAKANL